MDQHPIIAEWNQDYEFLALPTEHRAAAVGGFFDEQVADDEFRALPQEEQVRIKNNFLTAHVSDMKGIEDPTAGAWPGDGEMTDETAAGDYSRSFGIGLNRFAQTVGRGLQWAGAEETGQWIEGKSKEREEELRSELTPAFQAEQRKPFLSKKDGEFFGEGATSFAKIAGTILESAPSMAVGMGTGSALTQGFMKLGLSSGLSGILGGGIGEGVVAAAETAKDFEDIILEAPEAQLTQSEEFQKVYKALPDHLQGWERTAAARRQLASDVAQWGAAKVGAVTAVLGAPSGHGLGKILGGESGKTLLRTMGKQGAMEAMQEAPQSGYETFARNQVIQRNVNPRHSLTEGIGEAVVGGAIVGGVMGAALGGTAHQSVDLLDDSTAPRVTSQAKERAYAEDQPETPPQEAAQPRPDAGYTEEDVKRRYEETHAAPFPETVDLMDMGEPEVRGPSPAFAMGMKDALNAGQGVPALPPGETQVVQPQVIPMPQQRSTTAMGMEPPRLGLPVGMEPIPMGETPSEPIEIYTPNFQLSDHRSQDFELVPDGQRRDLPVPSGGAMGLVPVNSQSAPQAPPAQVQPTLEAQANEAATSPENDTPQPTQAQKEAGNYRKGHTRINGLEIAIENPAGSERSGTDPSGKPWSVEMQHHYGYIKGTVGKDKDHLDVFIKDGVDTDVAGQQPVYVVDQVDEDGTFDEHKIMMGFESQEEAEAGYLSNYEEGWQGMGAITEMSPLDFKRWTKKRRKTKQPVGELSKPSQKSSAPELQEETVSQAVETISSQEEEVQPASSEPSQTDESRVLVDAVSEDTYANPRQTEISKVLSARLADDRARNVEDRSGEAGGRGTGEGSGEPGTGRGGTVQPQAGERRGDDGRVSSRPEPRVFQVDLRNTSIQRLLERLGGLFGRRVAFVATDQPNVLYVDGASLGNTIIFRPDARAPHLFLLGHELVHEMRQSDPDLYEQTYNYLKPYMKRHKALAYGAELNSRRNEQGLPLLSEDKFHEEIVADVLGDSFMSNKFWSEMAQMEPTLFGKLAGHVQRLIAFVLKKTNFQGEAHQYFSDLERVREILVEATAELSNRAKTRAENDGGGDKGGNDAGSFSQEDVDFERARHAYYNTSHTPDKRAKQEQDSYFSHMQTVEKKLNDAAKNDDQKAMVPTLLAEFKEGYLKRLNAALDAKSRTASPMITGPARFPVERNRKRMETERKRLDELFDWDKKAQRRMLKRLDGARTQEERQGEVVQRLKLKVDSALAALKEIESGEMRGADKNAFKRNLVGVLERSAANGETDAVRAALDHLEAEQKRMGLRAFTPRHKVWGFAEKAQARATAKSEATGIEPVSEFDGGRIVDNRDMERVQLIFDDIPSAEVRSALKSSGWRWSRKEKAWQRKNTPNGIAAARRIARDHFGEKPAVASSIRPEDEVKSVSAEELENSNAENRAEAGRDDRGESQGDAGENAGAGAQGAADGPVPDGDGPRDVSEDSREGDERSDPGTSQTDEEAGRASDSSHGRDRSNSLEQELRKALATEDGYFDLSTDAITVYELFDDDGMVPSILDTLEAENRTKAAQADAETRTDKEIDDPVVSHIWGRLDGKSLRDWPGLYKTLRSKFGSGLFRSREKGGVGLDELADELNTRGLFSGDSDALAEYLKEAPGIQKRRGDVRGGVRFSLGTGKPRRGMKKKMLEVGLVRRLQRQAENALPLEIVQSESDLPAHILEQSPREDTYIEGVHDPGTGKVYLVADNIPSVKRAVALWLHEQGVHNGLKGIFGAREYRHIMGAVYKTIEKRTRLVSAVRGRPFLADIAEIEGFDLNDPADQLRAAEEYIARCAEKVKAGKALTRKERGAWRKLVEAFLGWLRDIGVNIGITEREIAWIVDDAVQWTMHGEPEVKFRHDPAPAFSKGEGVGIQPGWDTAEQATAQVKQDMAKWGKQLDAYESGGLHPRKRLIVGQTSDVLRKLGVESDSVVATQRVLKKILHEKHGMPMAMVKQLPFHLAAPLAVFDSATQANSLLVLTEMDFNGEPVVAALHLDIVDGGVKITEVASAYGKRGVQGFVKREFAEGRVRYWDKKKYSEVQRMSGLQLPGAFELRSKKKILTEKDIVKPSGSYSQGKGVKFSHGKTEQERAVNSLKDMFSGKEAKSAAAAAKAFGATPSQAVEAAFKGEMPEVLDKLDNGDLTRLGEVAGLPHWLAKRLPGFKAIYERQLTRMDERAFMLKESLEDVADVFALDGKALAELRDLIWEMDGQQIKDLEGVDKFVPVIGEDGRPVRENGRAVLEMNIEYYDKFQTWLESKGYSRSLIDHFMAVRRSLDSDFLRAYDAMRQMSEIDDDTIKQFRTQINHVHNYFPHKRKGAYHVIGKVQKKGKMVTVYREHFDAPTKAQARQKGRARAKALKADFPDAQFEVGINERLPDELYEFPIDTNAMEQVVHAAAEKLGDGEQAKEIKGKLSEAVADVLKSRGWGSHAIGRSGIPGHETEDIQGLLYEYKSGLSGWLTKMDASRDFTSMLSKIDASNHPNEYRYAVEYVQNMLRNADKLDRTVGKMKSIAFFMYLGFNLKTAALNMTQNLILGIPRLGMDVQGATHRYVGAAMDSIIAHVTGGKHLPEDEQRLLTELYQEDVITEGFIREVRGNINGITLSSMWDKAVRAAGWPMAMAERFNRSSLALSAYRAARDGKLKKQSGKLGYDDAKAFAENVVRDAHFVYGKTNLPQALRASTTGRAMNAAYTFRTFSHNLLSAWHWMATQQGEEGRKAIAKSMAATFAIGGVASMPFFHTVMSLWQYMMDDDDDWIEEIRKELPEVDWLRDVVSYGLPSLAGVNLGGSLGMEMPTVSRLEPGATIEEHLSENITDFIGIPWDLIIAKPSRAMKARKAGDAVRAIEELAPTFIKNMMAAYRLKNEGQRSVSGKPINAPGKFGPRKLDDNEALAKAIGFQPLSSTKTWNEHKAREVSKAIRNDKATEFANRIFRAGLDKKPEDARGAFQEWQSWNKDMRKEQKPWMIILPGDLTRRIKARAKGDSVSPRGAMRMVEQMKAK